VSPKHVEAFQTNRGARVYRLPLDLFPGLEGYAHLVITGKYIVLVDVGSGFGESNEQLESALAAVRSDFGERVSWQDLTHVLITHAHIDHFGGLHFVRERTHAPIGIHELDLRVLAHYEQRLDITAHRLRSYLIESGLLHDQCEEVMALYLLNKQLFRSIMPDFTFQACGMQIGGLRMIHVPGHCPGQVVIQIDDLLLSADHVLAGTSPHQAPESLCFYTGLGHYLESLDRIQPLARDIRVALGGHEEPIHDLAARIEDIRSLHLDRLHRVLTMLDTPHTIAEIAFELFPEPEGYHKLLALEETGAHVEFLVNRAMVGIANAAELKPHSSVPLTFQRMKLPEKVDLGGCGNGPDKVGQREGVSSAERMLET
jgi:glyoxylase-like metal-dependent hydrolase (beta-lactamase superfamily II)